MNLSYLLNRGILDDVDTTQQERITGRDQNILGNNRNGNTGWWQSCQVMLNFSSAHEKNNSISITIYSTESTGQFLTVWLVQKGSEKDYTKFAISAIGEKTDFEFLADYQVIAAP